ncbi:MAG TPA: cysteine hydrolase family protein [Symbiobacteriaceae bacterium]|nr:cysteine hydrolase family protein [Symbiobacteriaceae bacterium]
MGKALLVIDVQNEYFAPDGKLILPDGPKGLEKIHQLLDAARASGIPVFHIVHERLTAAGAGFQSGTPGAEIHPSIQVLPGETKIVKHFPGSFTQTPLEAYLRRAGADMLIVCGFMAQMCCDTTTRQAREKGFTVLYAADATAARDLTVLGKTVPHTQVHETTCAVMTQFAEVLPADEIIKRMAQ